MKREPDAGSGAVIIALLMPHAPVLVPDVGGGHAAGVTSNAMREAAARLVAVEPGALVVISPHAARRPGAFGVWSAERISGALAQFGAPQVSVDLPVDRELLAQIAGEAERRGLRIWEIRDETLDHGTIVPLWFAVGAGWRGPAVVLSLNYRGEGGQIELGEAIAAAGRLSTRRIAVIASGDMSHRLTLGSPCGFDPRASEADRVFIELLRRGAYREVAQIEPALLAAAGEDAVDSTLVALAAVEWACAGHRVLSYEAPFGVGYGVAILHDASALRRETPGGRSADFPEEPQWSRH